MSGCGCVNNIAGCDLTSLKTVVMVISLMCTTDFHLLQIASLRLCNWLFL